MDSPPYPSGRTRAGFFRGVLLAAVVALFCPRAPAAVPGGSPAQPASAQGAPAAGPGSTPVADPFKALQDIAAQNYQKWQTVDPDVFKRLQNTQAGAASSGDFKKLQDAAPEVLTLKVTALNTNAVKAKGNDANELVVATVQALVVSTVRSATGLGPGMPITLSYAYTAPSATPAANAPAMLALAAGQQYLAYLTGGPSPATYYTAAGSQSFLDPAAALLAGSGNNPGSSVLIDPSLLPTPINPVVPGVIKMVRKPPPRPGYTPDDKTLWLDEFGQVKLGDDGQWYADLPSIPHLLPLKTYGTQQPVLLDYYVAPARAPAGQPSILIYSAGTIDESNPAGAPLNIEWALILDPRGNILGDAMWAARKTTNSAAVPLPVWTWYSYKLEVQEPYDPTTKEISLVPVAGVPNGSIQIPVNVRVVKQSSPGASTPAANASPASAATPTGPVLVQRVQTDK